MTDAPAPATTDDGQPTVEQAALAAEAAVRGGTVTPSVTPHDERPERAVAAAFAGGLVLGLLLKRLAR